MTNESEYDAIVELLSQADGMPDTPMKVAVIEEAVRRADALGDLEWQFDLRLYLISAAFSCGVADKLMAALTWCLAMFDRQPERFDAEMVLWQCKHGLSYVASFPTVSREAIHQLTEDVIDRYRRFGASLRPVYLFAASNELDMGYPEEARNYWQKAIREPIDEYAEGPDWELFFETELLKETESAERALAKGRPMLTGETSSPEVFPWMAMLLLVPLVDAGDAELAAACQQQAYRTIWQNSKFLGHIGNHMEYFAYVGQAQRAVYLFERHLDWAVRSHVPSTRFSFYLSGWFVFRQIARQAKQVRLLLPREFPIFSTAGTYATAELLDWLEAAARDLAEQFDRRNKNTSYSEAFDVKMKLEQKIEDRPADG